MEWQGFSWHWLPKGSLFFLFHFYVNVFSITGKWENILRNHPPHARGK